MKLLLDSSKAGYERRKHFDFIGGQLLTPLTQYSNWGGVFAVDNGAFSKFQRDSFLSLLGKNTKHRDKCLFVCCPDVVGSARRTLEAFDMWYDIISPWPVALVAQDGQDDLPIPWKILDAIFIGGSTHWKESKGASDIVKTAKIMDVHVHIGRVNTPKRWKYFEDMGADTCDGSGLCRFDWMLDAIKDKDYVDSRPLFASD